MLHNNHRTSAPTRDNIYCCTKLGLSIFGSETVLGGWASVDKMGAPLARPSDAALLSCWAVACDICACPARRMPVLFCIVRKARSELCADSRCSAVS